jgi:hypothetical protein
LPRKVIAFSIKKIPVEDPDKLVELLSRALKTDFVRIEVRGSKLIVELAGDSASIRTSIIRLRDLVRQLSVEVKRGGMNVYRPTLIYREVGLAVPLDVVAEVLRANGYKAQYTSEGLETTAPLDEVLSASKAVADALNSMKHLPLTTGARKAVAAVSALAGVPPDNIIETGLSNGILEETGSYRITVKGSWRESFKRLLEVVGGGAEKQ